MTSWDYSKLQMSGKEHLYTPRFQSMEFYSISLPFKMLLGMHGWCMNNLD